jgi:aspartyl-tRNA(Asn)/glutamyl-tRNA(Gln) amidotransferase subunit A
MYSDNRSAGFGREVQNRVLVGSFALSNRSYASFFQKAQQVRHLITKDFQSVFNQGVHVLLTPTSATAARSFDDIRMQSSVDGFSDDIMTVPASLAGMPRFLSS